MKKLLFLGVAVLMAIGALGSPVPDDRSSAMLETLKGKVAGWGNYRVEFSVTVDGQKLAGNYEVSGERYRVQTPDIELFCDGKTRWEVNRTDRTVMIDPVDPNDRSVMANPTRLFDFLDGSYTHRFVGPAIAGGVSCNRIELKDTALSTTNAQNNQTIEAYLSATTGEPVRLVYTMPFLDADAVIDVVKITPRITLDSTVFDYNPARYADFEIIDFR